MMHLKPEDTIIIANKSIRPGLIEWLNNNCGIYGTIKERVTEKEIENKHVIGEIPAKIAKNAFCITSINYNKPIPKDNTRWGKLKETYEDFIARDPELFTYVVVPVVDTDPTDYY